jgi:uncharacterized membrane protein
MEHEAALHRRKGKGPRHSELRAAVKRATHAKKVKRFADRVDYRRQFDVHIYEYQSMQIHHPGIFFAFSSFVMAALGRIPPVQGIAAMNSINLTVINPSFMSAFVGTGLLCLVVGVRSLFLWNQGAAKLVMVASLMYLVGSFGVTLVFNVPLNNQLASIADPAQAVAFWPN